MDMSKAYIHAVLDRLPDGQDKIVFDRYHLMGHMGKAVDQVWKEEHARLSKVGILLSRAPSTSGCVLEKIFLRSIGGNSMP